MNDRSEPWGGYASRPEKNPEKYEITVADKTFPMSHWREGVLYFLFGIWSGDRKFWHDPSICFGELKLILKTRDCRVPEKDDIFIIEGVAPDMSGSIYFGNYSLWIGNGRCEVMDGLARFVKDRNLGRMDIRFDDSANLMLFSKERPSEYGCALY